MKPIIGTIETFPSPSGLSREEVLARLLDVVIDSLEENKAENVVILDLAGRANFADRMVVATCLSARQMSAIAHHLERRLKEESFGHARVEGDQNSDWVLMDAGDVVVHLFMPESRDLYALERMWSGDFDRVEEDVAVGQVSTLSE